MLEKIPCAIVGLGRIASLLEKDSLREKPCTHAGAIAVDPDCRLVAGCDISEERRLLFSQEWRVPVYEDAAEMLSLHKPQILVVATHPDSHYHYCRLAARFGVQALICEKPLADNIRSARKIARIASQGGMAVIVNHERRYSQDYILAKTILDSGQLGSLLSVRSVLYMGKNRRLVDVLWHDGTHLADAIMFLSNAVLKHRRRWGTHLNASAGTAWLEGTLCREKRDLQIPVILEIGAGRDHLVFEMEFSCEKGRLRIGNGIFEIWESKPSPYAEQFRSLALAGSGFSGPTGYFTNMVKDAAACALDSRRVPRSNAADGLRVIEYLHSVRSWG